MQYTHDGILCYYDEKNDNSGNSSSDHCIATKCFSCFPAIVAYVDESETDTDQEIRQENICIGFAVCINTAENLVDDTLLP
jgi:hypothetical protein